jgi:hypothetical protein
MRVLRTSHRRTCPVMFAASKPHSFCVHARDVHGCAISAGISCPCLAPRRPRGSAGAHAAPPRERGQMVDIRVSTKKRPRERVPQKRERVLLRETATLNTSLARENRGGAKERAVCSSWTAERNTHTHTCVYILTPQTHTHTHTHIHTQSILQLPRSARPFGGDVQDKYLVAGANGNVLAIHPLRGIA